MKLSLRFFCTKLADQYTGTVLLMRTETLPCFSTLGIITKTTTALDDILYIDLMQRKNQQVPHFASVITLASRAELFETCNLIILPDTADIAEATELVSKTFTRYFHWSDAILEAIAENANLQTIIDMTAPIFENPVYIADSSFKMLASWGGDFDEINPTWKYQVKFRYLPYSVMQNLIDSGELEKLYNKQEAWLIKDSKGFTALPFISKAIRRNGVHYGNFYSIELYHSFDECDLELADYLGTILSTAVRGNLNYLETSSLYNAHFLEGIIEGSLTDKQIMVDQLRVFNWKLEGNYLLALFDTHEDNDAIRHHMMALLSSALSAQCLSYRGNVLVILSNDEEQGEQDTQYLKQIAKDFNRSVALSEPFLDFSLIKKFYNQVRYSLDSLRHKGLRGKLASYDETFLEHLKDYTDEDFPLYTPTVLLQRHDETHHTEYCHTLLIWLIHDRNSVRAADALYIHRNSLAYRLERINEIIGVDLDDFTQRLRLLLSLQALRVEKEREAHVSHPSTP